MLEYHVNKLDNELVMNSGGFKDSKKKKLHTELDQLRDWSLDALFILLNIHQIEGNHA